ncbi:MAG TPA: restriction endonuclease subunit S [Methanoregula sp.]|nr:restriction endonuclease subunit S [Methanoregula sp.]
MKKKKVIPKPEYEIPVDVELPEGWKSVILEDYIYVAARIGWRGLKREEYTKEGPLFLAVKDIQENGFIDFQNVTDHLSEYRYDESPEIQLKEEDIIITKDGTIGKIGFVKDLPGKVTVNSSLLVVRPSSEILPRYLFFYFKSPSFQKIVRERITGSAVPHLFQKDIKKFRILVPPLLEQQRIVARVEALMANINAARERLQRMPLIMKKFRQAVLAAACEGRLTEGWRGETQDSDQFSINCEDIGDTEYDSEIPVAWRLEKIKNVCETIVDCPHSTPKWTLNGEICLRTTNFKPGDLDLAEVRYVSHDTYLERISRLEPHENDIVYSREGGILGIACIIPKGLKICLGQRMMLLRVDQTKTDPKFIQNFLNSPIVLKKIKDLIGGTSSPHLNVADVKNLCIPLPPLADQHEIIRRVEALFARADAVEREVAAATKRADALTQAVLAKAFAGKL